jgi:hypothetical protein
MVDLSRPGDYIIVDLVIFDTPYYIEKKYTKNKHMLMLDLLKPRKD